MKFSRRKHPDRQGITTVPTAYFNFAKDLRKGDVVIVCGCSTNIVAWGIVEGRYLFLPTRKQGRHCRRVSWTKMDIPFIFTKRRQMLYRIPQEETHQLKDALINKVFQHSNVLPFGFIDNGYELEIPFASVVKNPVLVHSNEIPVAKEVMEGNPQGIDDFKNRQIMGIVSALQESFR